MQDRRLALTPGTRQDRWQCNCSLCWNWVRGRRRDKTRGGSRGRSLGKTLSQTKEPSLLHVICPGLMDYHSGCGIGSCCSLALEAQQLSNKYRVLEAVVSSPSSSPTEIDPIVTMLPTTRWGAVVAAGSPSRHWRRPLLPGATMLPPSARTGRPDVQKECCWSTAGSFRGRRTIPTTIQICPQLSICVCCCLVYSLQ